MIENKKILAVIPARGGSKGIPDKNMQLLNGIPLFAHSIITAQNCKYIDDIVVSTDSDLIAKIADEYGAWVPFMRPAELAGDASKTIDVLVYTVRELERRGAFYDYLIVLQPTQPYREAAHLNESIELIVKNHWNSLLSVSEASVHPILMRKISKEGILENLLPMASTVRRQDFPPVYQVNGSIYINRLDESFDGTVSLNDNAHPYMMEQKYSLDIDTWEDLQYAQWLMREETNEDRQDRNRKK